ncbi:MAG: hypothetical protein GY822_31685 [Deltaproteobacteria bacterium]|nr:hypothetical protein [Deltaproteobacteria bacterium]
MAFCRRQHASLSYRQILEQPFQKLTISRIHMAPGARNFAELNPDAGIYIPRQDAGEMCIALGDVCELGDFLL